MDGNAERNAEEKLKMSEATNRQVQEISVLEPYVKNLDDMINYHGDSIVSKIIANKKAGAVTMFAFDKGQGVSEQSLPFDSVLFVTSGEMEITIDGGPPLRVGKDMMVYIPADTPHIVSAISPLKMLSILIRVAVEK